MPTFILRQNWPQLPETLHQAWIDVDLKSYGAPATAIGVMVVFVTDDNSSYTSSSARAGVRPNGSTDIFNGMWRFSGDTAARNYRERFRISGMDGNQIIELYKSDYASSGTRAYVAGWILQGEAVLVTNQVPNTGTITAGWSTYSCANFDKESQTPVAWITNVCNDHWNAEDCTTRKNGSSYAPANDTKYRNANSGTEIIPYAGNDNIDILFEQTTSKSSYTIGIFTATSGYTALDPPTEITPPQGGATGLITVSTAVADSIIWLRQKGYSAGQMVEAYAVGETGRLTDYTYHGPCNRMVQLNGSKQFYGSQSISSSYQVFLIDAYFSAADPAVPPTYQDITDYYGWFVERNLATGWSDHDPDGFTGGGIPHGLTLDTDGMVTGHPHPEIPEAELTYELEFISDGTSTWISTPVRPAVSDEYTVTLELKYDTGRNNSMRFIGYGNQTFTAIDPQTSNRVVSYFYGSGNWPGNIPATPGGVWNTIRVYYAGNTGKGFSTTVNANTASSQNFGSTAHSYDFHIGMYANFNFNDSFDGRIRNVKMYSGEEGNGGTLIHHWPINDNSTTITDIVGTADGTLGGNGGVWHQVGEPTYVFSFNASVIDTPFTSSGLTQEFACECEFWVDSATDKELNNLMGFDGNGFFVRARSTGATNNIMINHGGTFYTTPVDTFVRDAWNSIRVYHPGTVVGGRVTVTLNGTEYTSDNDTGTTDFVSAQFGFGSHAAATAGVNSFVGKIRHGKLYTGNPQAAGSVLRHYYLIDDNATTISDLMEVGDATLTAGSGSWGTS